MRELRTDPSPPAWQRRLTERLAAVDAAGLRRVRRVLSGAQQVDVIVDGQRLINFSSNDYLGLAAHPEVVSTMQQACARYGVGAGAAHLVSGHSEAHEALEQALAEFTGRERAMLFSTGYMANLGLLSALAQRGDWILEDRLNHASLLDGAVLSGARLIRYPHGDTDALDERLSGQEVSNRLIVTDGVFSMDGDLAPLPRLSELAHRHEACLIVDDAHGLGVLGGRGAGSTEHWGMTGNQAVPVLMGTLGKAMGTFGAFVAGSSELIECLIQTARTFIYTTALPPALAVATLTSLRLVREEPWRRQQLLRLIARFRLGLTQRGWGKCLLDSVTPIQAVVLGTNSAATEIGLWLSSQGFWVGVIRPPTVPKGTARLRIALSAQHTEHQIDALVVALDAILSRLLPDRHLDQNGAAVC
ncbi:MAG: 8-amino-7-oxononanoate synthase [Methylococcaceae bacterium]